MKKKVQKKKRNDTGQGRNQWDEKQKINRKN